MWNQWNSAAQPNPQFRVQHQRPRRQATKVGPVESRMPTPTGPGKQTDPLRSPCVAKGLPLFRRPLVQVIGREAGSERHLITPISSVCKPGIEEAGLPPQIVPQNGSSCADRDELPRPATTHEFNLEGGHSFLQLGAPRQAFRLMSPHTSARCGQQATMRRSPQ